MATKLAECYIAVGTKDALYRGRVFLRTSVLRHAEPKFQGSRDFQTLKAAVDRVVAAEHRVLGT